MAQTPPDSTSGWIQTPWGDLRPKVELAPLVYLALMYGVVQFLPFNVFAWLSKAEDGPFQWLQFAAYLVAGFCGCVMASRGRQRWAWLAFGLLFLLVAGEEISWGERLTSVGIDSIRSINAQGETTLHNIPAVQNYMHLAYIVLALVAGWLGWRLWPGLDVLPSRNLSLYFLPVALFYAYFDLSWITLGQRIPNHQEVFELLLACGMARHGWRSVGAAGWWRWA